MRDISSPILHADACQEFEYEILPMVKHTYDWQYANWSQPRVCG